MKKTTKELSWQNIAFWKKNGFWLMKMKRMHFAWWSVHREIILLFFTSLLSLSYFTCEEPNALQKKKAHQHKKEKGKIGKSWLWKKDEKDLQTINVRQIRIQVGNWTKLEDKEHKFKLVAWEMQESKILYEINVLEIGVEQ